MEELEELGTVDVGENGLLSKGGLGTDADGSISRSHPRNDRKGRQ